MIPWRKKQQQARNDTKQAIKNGILVRQPCEVCGSTKSHAHHIDYNKPLEIKWLCSIHHAEEHFNLRMFNGEPPKKLPLPSDADFVSEMRFSTSLQKKNV